MLGLAYKHTAPYVKAMSATDDTPRRRVPEQTRDRLVVAAAELFAEQGLDGPSLDAICERAGYTRGAFYVHFGTREDLVAAVAEKVILEFLDFILQQGPRDLPAIIDTFVRLLSGGELPLVRRVRISQLFEACARSPELTVKLLVILAQAQQRVADAVRDSQAAGIVRADAKPEAIAEILLALALGAQVALQLGAPYDAPAVQAELARMMAPPAAGAARADARPSSTRPPSGTQKRRASGRG